ncbi:hypothetical protein LIER_41425 [Lithospermum erythrorhizon]|uniref:Conserved oligomeric Golgi complex subunit 7 n=1 Tax=Lithospermum erythrorhizon TaxID=34254 RepID=A0AAV3R967_LITER
MMDLSAFCSSKFEAKKWINGVVQTRHPQEALDKHLVDIEMKLQMLFEEISANKAPLLSSDCCAIIIHTQNFNFTQIYHYKWSSAFNPIYYLEKGSMDNAEGSSAESIATLSKVDTVKRRMEAAYETLQDAAGLTQLSSTVEDVFSSGDLPRAAETLANMRHCLSAVGEVAEFANIKRQLEVLEDRLDSMVQPQLTDSLTNHKVAVAQDMRKILVRIGRFKSLEMHYTKVHLKPIRELWEDFETRQQSSKIGNEKDRVESLPIGHEFPPNLTTVPFSSWLPTFYDGLLLYLEQEWKW